MNMLSASVKTPEKKRSMYRRLARLFRFEQTGGALVEMALAMPIMLCMMTGIFSMSVALYQKLLLAEAMSSGGRVLAAERGMTDPCADTVAAIDAAAPSLATGKIGLKISIGTANYGTNTSTVSCTAAGGANNAIMPAGATATITATYPCSLNIFNIKGLTCAIGEQVAEVVQ
jgi:Flp pilus assembly protein TadG